MRAYGPTVSAGYTRALLAFAMSKGAKEAALLDRSALVLDELNEPDARILTSKCVALMHAAVELTGDPAFALHFGEAVRTEDLSLVWLVAGGARTVEAGRAEANRFSRLVHDGGQDALLLDLVRDAGGTWLVFNSAADDPHLIEAAFAWCVRETNAMLKAKSARASFLRAVHFMHSGPDYRTEYERIFQVPVFFSSARNALLVDDAFLSVEMPRSNAYVTNVMRERAEVLLAGLKQKATTRGRVESLLSQALQKGGMSIDKVARELGLSRATLYRRLKQEGVSFEALLDELRRDLALRHLAENVSVTKTAYLLGFSDPAAFSRAFKRWTGKSPRSVRNSS